VFCLLRIFCVLFKATSTATKFQWNCCD